MKEQSVSIIESPTLKINEILIFSEVLHYLVLIIEIFTDLV